MTLSSRNNSLIFWTETYYDSSISCEWGTIFGLWIQQEADDEPVRSMLKCPGEPGSKYKHNYSSSQGLMEYKTNEELFWFRENFVFVLHSSTLNLKLYGGISSLCHIISAHNCIEIQKLLLLSSVGHTGYASGPLALIRKAKYSYIRDFAVTTIFSLDGDVLWVKHSFVPCLISDLTRKTQR